MSTASTPVARPTGRALIVGSPACRSEAAASLQRLGYQCAEADDPYGAMMEVCRQPLAYRVVVLSLAGLYREELSLIRSVKQRFPHLEVWLTHTDGRQAALAEALRLGADGLLADDRLYRTGTSAPLAAPPAAPRVEAPAPSIPSRVTSSRPAPVSNDAALGEPVLTAEELRALLEEQPSLPSGDGA